MFLYCSIVQAYAGGGKHGRQPGGARRRIHPDHRAGRYPLCGKTAVGGYVIHDADECHDETLVQLHGGHVVRVPCSLDEVLVWFG
jgi:hypothetical protein